MEQSFAGTRILEFGFANGPILLPMPGMGTGTAQLFAGRLSIPASSEQSMPFSDFFWLRGGVGAGSLRSSCTGICKNNSKTCFIPEPLPGWDYFWSEGVARQCQGDVGVPVPSLGTPQHLFGIVDPNIPCWIQPFPMQEPIPKIQLLSKNYRNRSRNVRTCPEGAADGSQIQNLPWKAKPAEPKGRESRAMEPRECSVSHFMGLMIQLGWKGLNLRIQFRFLTA